jgi:mRNA interferase MazF
MLPRPFRGDVWLIEFDPVRGHEQGGTRPGVVVSTDVFNRGPAELHVVLPITRTFRRVRWRVEVQPPEGGLRETSYIKCEDVRSLSMDRFLTRWGTLSQQTLTEVADRLRILLQL